MKSRLLIVVAGLLVVGAVWFFRSENPAPSSASPEAVAQQTARQPSAQSETGGPMEVGVATVTAHRAALQDRVVEIRQRRTDLTKKMESIEQRLAEKGNVAGPTHLEEAKAALHATLQKEELEERQLLEAIDGLPAKAATP